MRKYIILFLLMILLFNLKMQAQGDAATAQVAVASGTETPEGVGVKLKEKFIEGNPLFMGFVALALILGLTFCIERIIYLNLCEVNTDGMLEDLDIALTKGNVESAKEICCNTRGPVASICYDGLMRIEQGQEAVDKALTASGSVQLGFLERGTNWISLFVKMAPMLGFLGTVVGMITAFDGVQDQGSISPSVIAGGMKIALITTVFGLFSALILQLFYNYILTKIDSLTREMEQVSIRFMDMVIAYDMKYRQ
jgi:biopolymer transport protein ExbB